MPTIQCDSCFLKTDAAAPTLTVLTVHDEAYRYLLAVPVSHKGAADSQFAARALASFITYLGLPRVSVQGDSEASLMSVVRAACARVPGATPRNTQENDTGANGRAERAHQTLQGLARTLRDDLGVRTGVQVSSGQDIAHWLVRHAGWLWSHFARTGADKRTAHHRHFERDYVAPVLPFAERVMWKSPKLQPLKLKSSWGYGLWLGRTQSSNAHVLGTRAGVVLARSVRRLTPKEREDPELISSMRGTPARARPKEDDQQDARVTEHAPAAGAVAAAAAATATTSTPAAGTTSNTQPQPMDTGGAASSSGGPGPPQQPVRPEPADIEGDSDDAPLRAKRQRGRPPTRVWTKPGDPEYTEGCPGCDGRGYRHNAACLRKRAALALAAGAGDSGTQTTTATDNPTPAPAEAAGDEDMPTTAAEEDAPPEELMNQAAPGERTPPTTEEDEQRRKTQRVHDLVLSVAGAAASSQEDHADFAVELPLGAEFYEDVAAGTYREEDTGEQLDGNMVAAGVRKELTRLRDLEVFEPVARDSVRERIWSSRWCYRLKTRPSGEVEVRARFVVRQFASNTDAAFFSPTPGMEAIRTLLALALRGGLDIYFGDVSVAFMHTPLAEQERVTIEPPAGIYPDGCTVWRLKKALNGLRDASRLFLEHFASVGASSLDLVRAVALPTLFVRMAGPLYVLVHVDDLMVVGARQLCVPFFAALGEHLPIQHSGPLTEGRPQIYVGCRFTAWGGPSWKHRRRATSTRSLANLVWAQHGRLPRQQPHEETHRRTQSRWDQKTTTLTAGSWGDFSS